MKILAATNASDLIHETYLEHQETFLRIQLHQLHRRHRFEKGCCREEIPFLPSTALSFEARRNLSRKGEGRADQGHDPNAKILEEVANLESSILCRRSPSAKLCG